MEGITFNLNGEKYSFVFTSKKNTESESNGTLSVAIGGIAHVHKESGKLEAITYKGYDIKKDAIVGKFFFETVDYFDDTFQSQLKLDINYVGQPRIYVVEFYEDAEGNKGGTLQHNGSVQKIESFSWMR